MTSRLALLVGLAAALAGCTSERPPFIEWLPDIPIVAAHRGGAEIAPENTLAAFRRAREPDIEAELIELDFHRDRFGELVVIHDKTIDRVTGEGRDGCDTEQDSEDETFGDLRVDELTFLELAEYDAGYCFEDEDGEFPYRDAGVTIPTLRSVLEEFPTQRFVLESKDHTPEAAAALLALLEELDAFDRSCVLDFDEDFIEAYAQDAPEEACIAHPSSGIRCWTTGDLTPFSGGGCPDWDLMWMPHERSGVDLARAGVVRDLHAAGMPVLMWTVDAPDRMQEILDVGADGVVTDRPDVMRDLVGRPGLN